MSESTILNNYANSMFRYEYLHEAWLHACEKYLNYVFCDDDIRGNTVVDYAFGRGNWAIAFARCGAERVIAVDASEDNCRKLRAYCEENNINNIEVICGNLAERELDIRCDILWLYGILHHVCEHRSFLEKILLQVSSDGLVISYTYNANSLREWVVSTARACILFENEEDFRVHSLWFTPAGRLRARDDLVAPYISWDTAATFVNHFTRSGWYPAMQFQDFAPWLHGVHSGEFNPYVVKFVRQKSSFVVAAQEDNLADLVILQKVSDVILKKLPNSLRTSFAIGLFNTHFLNSSNSASKVLEYRTNEQVVWEDFKYLLYAATMLNVSGQDFSEDMVEVWDAAMCSLRGVSCKDKGNFLDGSLIRQLLSETRIRL